MNESFVASHGSGDQPGKVLILDARRGDLVKILRAPEKHRPLSFTSDGKYLMTTDRSSISFWKTSDWSLYAELPSDGGYLRDIALSTDDRTLLALNDTGMGNGSALRLMFCDLPIDTP
jgi:hypothetical protein